MQTITVCVWIAFATLVTFCIGAGLGERQGYRAGWRAADAHYARIMSERVEEQIKDSRRVMALREKSAEKRGWDKCQEQF